jgi:dimethylargininase
LLAITRAVSRSMARCELTHLARRPIDIDLARAQHRAYEQALESLGVRVVALPEEPELPDSVFVEDTAIVLDDIAVLTRPGAESRRSETASIARALLPHRELATVEAPGLIDGGDVLRLGQTLYVGRSGRTNGEGMEQLRDHLARRGIRVTGVAVSGCLHLKSAVTAVGADTILVNPAWVSPPDFGMRCIEIDPSEPPAANALLIGDAVIYPASYPRTRERLERAGITVVSVDVSELEKAEGAVTCCSLVFAV